MATDTEHHNWLSHRTLVGFEVLNAIVFSIWYSCNLFSTLSLSLSLAPPSQVKSGALVSVKVSSLEILAQLSFLSLRELVFSQENAPSFYCTVNREP